MCAQRGIEATGTTGGSAPARCASGPFDHTDLTLKAPGNENITLMRRAVGPYRLTWVCQTPAGGLPPDVVLSVRLAARTHAPFAPAVSASASALYSLPSHELVGVSSALFSVGRSAPVVELAFVSAPFPERSATHTGKTARARGSAWGTISRRKGHPVVKEASPSP